LTVAALALGCGGGAASPKHTVPESQIATSGPGKQTRCADRAYDPTRGCVKHVWGVPVRASFRDHMGGGFRLVGVAIALDGEVLFETNDPTLLSRKQFPVLSTAVARGAHEIGARLHYRGHGYGVFAYLKGYRFEVAKSLPFEARDTDLELEVIGYEQSEVPLEERPAVRMINRSAR
jgi:hypothetical protein